MSFIYADDLCTTTQYPTFSQVEGTTEEKLGELTNTTETTVCVTLLASQRVSSTEQRVDLENTTHTIYVGVTLDKTLSYKQHIESTKMKVDTNISLLKKLTNTKWRTKALKEKWHWPCAYSTIEMEARLLVCDASRPCVPAGWLVLLLTKAWDVIKNLGVTNTHTHSLDMRYVC